MARSSRRSSRTGSSRSEARRSRRSETVFEQRNYVLLLVGIGLVVVGFVAMRLDNQLESLISFYIAPLIILGGYLEIIYAILWRPSSPEGDEAAA